LAVLSIEESAKAIINRFAAEGVLKVVTKNANHITTFTERELLDHRFKHAFLAGMFAEWLRYAPFTLAVDNLRKSSFTKEEVKELMFRAVQAHKVLQVDLTSGGQTAKEMGTLFNLLENLNLMKNRGLYVDHANGRLFSPRNVRRAEVERTLQLAEGIVQMTSELHKRGLPEKEKRLQLDANKRLLDSIRRAKRRVAARGIAQTVSNGR